MVEICLHHWLLESRAEACGGTCTLCGEHRRFTGGRDARPWQSALRARASGRPAVLGEKKEPIALAEKVTGDRRYQL